MQTYSLLYCSNEWAWRFLLAAIYYILNEHTNSLPTCAVGRRPSLPCTGTGGHRKRIYQPAPQLSATKRQTNLAKALCMHPGKAESVFRLHTLWRCTGPVTFQVVPSRVPKIGTTHPIQHGTVLALVKPPVESFLTRHTPLFRLRARPHCKESKSGDNELLVWSVEGGGVVVSYWPQPF